MALTYRTPIEDIVNFFEPQTQAVIANSAAAIYKQLEEVICQYFNYYMPAMAKRRLSTAGIYLSPYSAVAHSHPVCKTLENYILYTVLPTYINNKYFFVGIMERKLQLLKNRNSHLDSVQCINRYVTSADKMRYGNDFVVFNSHPNESLGRHGKGLTAPTLKDIVEPLQRRKAKQLFLHDELHHWSSKNLVDFLTHLRPDTLLGTLVYPPELLFKQTRSLNEWCYTFEIIGGTFFYYPDGVRSEGYQQPLAGGFLLKTSKIVLEDGDCYMVDVLCSKFSHHLVSLTRGEAINCTHRSFGPFEATASEELTALSPEYPICFPVSYDIVNKIYRYLRTLKEPDEQSAMAKLSQIVAEPTGAEIDFVEGFARLIIRQSSICSTILPDNLKLFLGYWLSKLPPILAAKIQNVREFCVNQFIKSLRPYNFTAKLCEVKWYDNWENSFDWLMDTSTNADIVSLLDSSFTSGAREAVPRWVGAPYTGLAPVHERAWRSLLKIPARHLFACIRRMYYHEVFCEHTRHISLSFVEEFVHSKLRSSFLIAKERRIHNSKTHVPIFELLGFATKRHLFVALRSSCARKMRSSFTEAGLDWFSDLRRCNQKFVSNVPDATGVHPALTKPWKVVIRDVLEMPRFKNSNIKQGASTPASSSSIPPKSITAPPEQKQQCAQSALQLACACGLSLPVRTLLFADHALKAPYDLKGCTAGWYCKEDVQYNCPSGSHASLGWPTFLDTWCEVNEIPAKYNSCLYQVYKAGSSTALHSDDLGMFIPEEGFLTVNLGGSATLSTECSGSVRSVVLDGAVFFEMPHGLQSTHKYSVSDCSPGRASLTFRCVSMPPPAQLAGSGPQSPTHEAATQCTSGGAKAQELTIGGVKLTTVTQPTKANYRVHSVAADGSCFWHSLSMLSGLESQQIKKLCMSHSFSDLALNAELAENAKLDAYTTDVGICAASIKLRTEIRVWNMSTGLIHLFVPRKSTAIMNVRLSAAHFEPIFLRNGCVVQAIAAALGRREAEVLKVIETKGTTELCQQLWVGDGLDLLLVELAFKCFSIVAHVNFGETESILNSDGTAHYQFSCSEGHITYCGQKKDPGATLLAKTPHNKSFSPAALEMLKSSGLVIEYMPQIERAQVLADSLFRASTGVLQSALFNNKQNLRGRFRQVHAIPVCVIAGTFGSGKSTLFKRLLEHGSGKIFDFVSPRRALADDFMAQVGLSKGRKNIKVGQENWRVHTFERFIDRVPYLNEGQVLIFDEMQLYPPGYFDLIFHLAKVDVHCFLVGDPCQSDYDSERDRLTLSALENNVSQLLDGREYPYKITSHRFLNRNFIGRLPCRIVEADCTLDQPHELRMHLENMPKLEHKYLEVFLVSSFDEKTIVYSYLPDATVLTFGESTGLTFSYGTILITSISERANDKRWLTALSRFRLNVCFLNCCGYDYNARAVRYKGRALAQFLCKAASEEHLLTLLPGTPQFTEVYGCKIGKEEGLREEKLLGDPWLKPMINLYQAPDALATELPEEVLQEQWFKTHLPREELESVRAQWVHKILAKEFREVRMGDLVSNQFTDEHSKQLGARQLTNAAERFETIYPRHRANDTVTFIMAVKKRLSFSHPGKERAKLHNAMNYGRALLKEFLKRVPLKPNHNKRFMDEALWNFEEKKVSKSAATIENHSGRSCRDWPIEVAQIFSKSQLCTKFDNRFRVAKAAQSIVCFQHAVLCRFAPYMRYIEMKVQEVLPRNFYIHSGKGLDELNAWVRRGKFDGVCTESDYEAFDASQDEYIMAFELELMNFLGLPHDLIEDYKYIKTSLGSKLGNFAIMRFSGEASTFLFNTLANMLFTFLRYEVKGHEFICFAGDDMCASAHLRKTEKYSKFLDKFKLKAKVQFTAKPTFCGWHLSPDGIYKKPQLVFERMCIAMELNNLSNCIDNYAIEVTFAYKLGERALNRMDEEEAGAFYNCVRLIIRNKHLLKFDVRTVFEVSDCT
ncbi:RNA-dependent RNA polymerase [Narcissus common latent virus]|uniref:RNA-dependent RNA polymerase n=1 Tax=Narcissus common latent virus TaxID=160844 RepID=Q0VZD1_9VIRU|nr:RNA-dependent RNA polymerase [Narcissus common latent virus]CAJ43605.1 RNA-dependent RNA polymerase [Narcissus common latent virus]